MIRAQQRETLCNLTWINIASQSYHGTSSSTVSYVFTCISVVNKTHKIPFIGKSCSLFSLGIYLGLEWELVWQVKYLEEYNMGARPGYQTFIPFL